MCVYMFIKTHQNRAEGLCKFFHPLVFFLPVSHAEARVPDLHVDLPCGWQRPEDLGHLMPPLLLHVGVADGTGCWDMASHSSLCCATTPIVGGACARPCWHEIHQFWLL